MKTYSMSNLSDREYDELLQKWTKRRNLYYLLSLLIIPYPLTIGFALFCNNNINFLKSGGRKTSNLVVIWFHIIIGGGMPLIVVPLLRVIGPFGHLVLGSRMVD